MDLLHSLLYSSVYSLICSSADTSDRALEKLVLNQCKVITKTEFETGSSKTLNQDFGPSQEYPADPEQGCGERKDNTGLWTLPLYFKKIIGTFSCPGLSHYHT